ncbi:MAG TPA: hypothetical protein EYG15_12790 [Deltaproteobacteria bacterium]|mgnify:FL=1|jgi:hypothetical protein|nr:hypothetical protein [SAR324 cluster bacterium]HBI29572.1 hypothetical protein [Deltaproteobacteria bacterium]HIF70143.1 hypothetical protein [Candidatus Lambdaproteobacteria bacterium]HIL16946.1 hypothetical protein [Deltaproteobacteria bacterium]|tara:strand:+ start:1385 stop:1999 length:615 start_codon:yes stop_codon:yes gene_type:complete
MLNRLLSLLFLPLSAVVVSAETVHLNDGSTLHGNIRGMDDQRIVLESPLTAQELKVERADISIIEFEGNSRSLVRRLGMGLIYRPSTGEEHLSLKNWLDDTNALELVIRYVSKSISSQSRFNLEGRLSHVYLAKNRFDLFVGGGLGFASSGSERGTILKAFSGAEFFMISLPDFSFGAELGFISRSKVDEEQSLYNAFTARYYF